MKRKFSDFFEDDDDDIYKKKKRRKLENIDEELKKKKKELEKTKEYIKNLEKEKKFNLYSKRINDFNEKKIPCLLVLDEHLKYIKEDENLKVELFKPKFKIEITKDLNDDDEDTKNVYVVPESECLNYFKDKYEEDFEEGYYNWFLDFIDGFLTFDCETEESIKKNPIIENDSESHSTLTLTYWDITEWSKKCCLVYFFS